MKTIFKLALIAVAMLAISGTTNASAQKFGYVNIEELISVMPEMGEVRTKLEALQKDLEGQMTMLRDELSKKNDEYERTMSTMTESVKRLKEEELQRIYQQMQNFQQSAQSDLEQQYQALMEPIIEKAQVAVNNVASEQGLAGVFTAAALIYTDKNVMVDVLPLAKKRLGIE